MFLPLRIVSLVGVLSLAVGRAAAQEETSAKFDDCVGRLLSPLRALASLPPASGSKTDWLEQVAQTGEALRTALRPDGTEREAVIETLIATVPDPIQTGLVHQFETAVQALRNGVEHADKRLAGPYFRDRSFLPWSDLELPAAKRGESEVCRNSLPGLMLFRNSSPSRPRVFAVLLVGEAPTVGLNRIAMLNALRVARRLEAGAGSLVRVVGPTFSGSAYSLRLALRAFADEASAAGQTLQFQVISGTANGRGVPQLLRDPLTQSSALSFSSTIAPERDIECAYLWFLRTRLNAQVQTAPRGEMPEVAMLSELGTEFGAQPSAADQADRCQLRAGVALAFPIYVSNLRDAYETLDNDTHKDKDQVPLTRPTLLDAQLTDALVAQDLEANPSGKTRAALDVMLRALLGEISRRGIRHVGIHATDVGDAIFLARRIRDVAPDVRLAFFDADALMFHPEFRSLLLGSLVVSSYPFLGVNDLDTQALGRGHVRGFPSALAEGVFNAVLAQRGGTEDDLSEYAFNDAVLPVWISTIARTGLEPTEVRPVRDTAQVIYRPTGRGALGARDPAQQGAEWYKQLRQTSLSIDPALPLPRLWTFLMIASVLGFFIDQTRQSGKTQRFSKVRMPKSRSGSDDRAADLAIARTKWFLYATIRSFLFVIALGYLGGVYILSLIARDTFTRLRTGLRSSDFMHVLCGLVIVSAVVIALYRSIQALRQFRHDYARFGQYVGERLLPRTWKDVRAGIVSGRISLHESPRVSKPQPPAGSSRPPLARWSLSLGLAPPVTRDEAARISFAQLRNIAVLTLALSSWFVVCLVGAALNAADWTYSRGASAVPLLTLNVLRSVPLLNGISPAAPALLCVASVYRWVVGRMARIALAHSVSRMSPVDGESDLVSTPIRLMLYPNHSALTPSDDGYTRCERDLLNAIWRPITGTNYVAALFAVMFLPIVLVALKPISTLEASWGTALLASGLALSMMLIGVTLIQQLQYWICLERLLKRTMTHRLGTAFGDIPAFIKDSVDEQLSRSSNVLLRWAACARQYVELATNIRALRHPRLRERATAWSQADADHVSRERSAALAAANAPDVPAGNEAVGAEEVSLCEALIQRAARTTELLEVAWSTTQPAEEAAWVMNAVAANEVDEQPAVDAAVGGAVVGRAASPPAVKSIATARSAHRVKFADRDDALAVVEHCFEPEEIQWLRRAQAFVATIVTLLIHRHVRQFRYFASTLTVCCLLLLLTLTSYPFEPFRLLLTWIWVVVGTVAAASLWIYVQLHRNTLVSLIAGTSPNRVTVDAGFVLRMFTWAGLPLLSVAAAQYPDLANLLFQLVAPFTRALH